MVILCAKNKYIDYNSLCAKKKYYFDYSPSITLFTLTQSCVDIIEASIIEVFIYVVWQCIFLI